MRPQYAELGMTPGLEELAFLVVVAVFYLSPILILVWFIRYLLRAARDRHLMRMDISKLADELELLRKAVAAKPSAEQTLK